jgi:hypothetical protein
LCLVAGILLVALSPAAWNLSVEMGKKPNTWAQVADYFHYGRIVTVVGVLAGIGLLVLYGNMS